VTSDGQPATYARAGVDIGTGHEAVDRIRSAVRSTYRPEVAGDIGGFGGLFAFAKDRWRDPVLVSGTDGAGTKVMIAEQTGVHDTIGIDLVAMSVNDVAAQGAEPLFFLDYVVCGKVDPQVIEDLVSGIAAGCRQAGCALIGGDIAEHPCHMAPGSFDLAGFCVGAVERDRLITGAAIRAGDVLVGLESSGLHANGYSLVRKVLLEDAGLDLGSVPDGFTCTLGEELLRPTLVYAPALLRMEAAAGTVEAARIAGGSDVVGSSQAAAERSQAAGIRGLAHVTGGGIPENLGRIVPDGLEAVVHPGSWPVPPIFGLVARTGGVAREEMLSTFNMGIGMIAVVAPEAEAAVSQAAEASGLRPHRIGEIVPATDRGAPGPVRVVSLSDEAGQARIV
jgi:phosphoribosylformylglycinamidine cyclo-ligase